MRRDVASGTLIIVGSLAGLVVMGLHPTGHGMLDEAQADRLARLNVFVHGLALAAVPVLFLGLLGLSRSLQWSGLATAAQVAFGFAGVGVTTAAVASGFVMTGLIAQLREGAPADLHHALLDYTHMLNQAFAQVHLVASSAAILLWSAALLRRGGPVRAGDGRALPASGAWRTAGIGGLLIGAAILLAFFAGHLRLDVHGFGLMILAQSAWMIAVGVLLLRAPRD